MDGKGQASVRSDGDSRYVLTRSETRRPCGTNKRRALLGNESFAKEVDAMNAKSTGRTGVHADCQEFCRGSQNDFSNNGQV